MSAQRFTNGSWVFRIWHSDGSGEVLAEFQYFDDAKKWAEHKAAADTTGSYASYLAFDTYGATLAWFGVKKAGQ